MRPSYLSSSAAADVHTLPAVFGTGRRAVPSRVASAPETCVSPVEQLERLVAQHGRSPSRAALEKALLAGSDILLLWAAFFLSRAGAWLHDDIPFGESLTVWWHHHGPVRLAIFAAISVVVVLHFWGALGHYSRPRPYWDETREIVLVLLAAFMADAMLVFLGKWQFSRLWLVGMWSMLIVLLPLSRLLIRRWLVSRAWARRPYIVIGGSADAAEVVAAFRSEPLMGFHPVALVTMPGVSGQVEIEGRPLPAWELSDELEVCLKKPGALHIVVALNSNSSESLRALAQRLSMAREDVVVVPPVAGLPLYGMELSHFFSHEILLLRGRNNLGRVPARIAKRMFDVAGSLVLLAVLAPFMLVVAAAVRRDGGSATFSHERIGRDGRPFKCLKFRTMLPHAEEVLNELLARDPESRREWARSRKLKADPRVTPIGRFLRRTSLDELPQLINVLRGEMSLVGPRPIVSAELERYGDMAHLYLKVRPGMSGLWQISGRSDTDYGRRVWLDRWYVQNWSLWYDLVILIRTIRVVLRSGGAY